MGLFRTDFFGMKKQRIYDFIAQLEIIGINPFVFIPKDVLGQIFLQANKDKSPITVCGMVNGKEYRQTLVKYKGEWRLYINTEMLDRSPGRIGENISVSITFDPESRAVLAHPKLVSALDAHPKAKVVFENIPASRRNEIIRYIDRLKTEDSVDKNVGRAIQFLLGKARFIGRDQP